MFGGVLSIVRVRSAVLIALCSWFAFSPITSFAIGNITLAWDPSPDPSIVSYRVYYGSASGNYTNSVQTGGATTATVSNLLEGVTYYFAATASDSNGLESNYSNETSGTVDTANKVPTLNALVNITLNEDAGPQTVSLSGISSGASNEVQTLTVTAASSNPALIPTPTVTYTSPNATGSLTFTPAAVAFGSATVTVTVNDGAASNNIVSRSFTVTVNPVNDAPTLNTLANVTLNEDAGLQTVNLSGISSGASNEAQTLTITATSSNPALIPTPTVTYTSPDTTGSVTFIPAASVSGSATVTVTVNDGAASNNIISRSFTVTVNPVNDPPTLNTLANVTLSEDAGLQTVSLSGISSGASNEVQTLTIAATSSNPALIPTPSVAYTSPNVSGSLTFTPVASTSGSATVTVTVNDGAASNNIVSRSFNVTVNHVNVPPTITTITNRVIAVGTATGPIPFTIGDAETPASSLTLSASSDDQAVVPDANITFGGSNGDRTVTVTPTTGVTGVTLITITVSDGTATATSEFELTVARKPAPPGNLRLTSQ